MIPSTSLTLLSMEISGDPLLKRAKESKLALFRLLQFSGYRNRKTFDSTCICQRKVTPTISFKASGADRDL
jgi:hypothetical protein